MLELLGEFVLVLGDIVLALEVFELVEGLGEVLGEFVETVLDEPPFVPAGMFETDVLPWGVLELVFDVPDAPELPEFILVFIDPETPGLLDKFAPEETVGKLPTPPPITPSPNNSAKVIPINPKIAAIIQQQGLKQLDF